MGREIRRVPPNWHHPKGDRPHGFDYLPKHEENYEKAASKWVEDCAAWSRGEHKSQWSECKYYWEYCPPPDESYCVDYDPDDKDLCTWWQLYETVSKGTPVSPAFATADELIDYLSTYGDYWEQSRAEEDRRPVNLSSRESVTKFVLGNGWAPSMMVIHTPGQPVRILEGIECVNAGDDTNGIN